MSAKFPFNLLFECESINILLKLNTTSNLPKEVLKISVKKYCHTEAGLKDFLYLEICLNLYIPVIPVPTASLLLVASVSVMYSYLIVERPMHFCLKVRQIIGASSKYRINPYTPSKHSHHNLVRILHRCNLKWLLFLYLKDWNYSLHRFTIPNSFGKKF